MLLLLLHSIVKLLCDHGADFSLTDVEGNTPRDLADKNGQNKCVKYLTQVMKQKEPKGTKRHLNVSMNLWLLLLVCMLA